MKTHRLLMIPVRSLFLSPSGKCVNRLLNARNTTRRVSTVACADPRDVVSRVKCIVSGSGGLRALCSRKVTRHEGGHSHASLLAPFLGQSGVSTLSHGSGSGRMGAPRVCLRAHLTEKRCSSRSNDSTGSRVRERSPQFVAPRRQIRELSPLRVVIQMARASSYEFAFAIHGVVVTESIRGRQDL